MTSVQLASLIGRNLTQPDITLMPAPMLRDVLVALNGALQDFYRLIPATHKQTTVSEILRAPENVEFNISARYENQLLNSPFSTSMRGCSVLLAEDPETNEVVAPNAVLDGYLGTTLLGGTATVYHDAIPLFEVIERVTSHVRLMHGGKCIRELVRDQSIRTLPLCVGRPTRYFLEPCGSGQGSDPEFILRVHPAPDVDYKVRFEAELTTVRVTFPQVQGTAVNLPVNDTHCESIILPMAEAKLLASAFWADRSKAAIIANAEQDALQAIKLIPHDVGLADNTCGTEAGF